MDYVHIRHDISCTNGVASVHTKMKNSISANFRIQAMVT